MNDDPMDPAAEGAEPEQGTPNPASAEPDVPAPEAAPEPSAAAPPPPPPAASTPQVPPSIRPATPKTIVAAVALALGVFVGGLFLGRSMADDGPRLPARMAQGVPGSDDGRTGWPGGPPGMPGFGHDRSGIAPEMEAPGDG